MNTQTKSILIGYHASCTDGFTAAWVTCRALEAEPLSFRCDLIPLKYSDEESEHLLLETLDSTSYSELYIVDFSLELDALKYLAIRFPSLRITILDHHKTAFERYSPGMTIDKDAAFKGTVNSAAVVLDNNESGASLCYSYFHGYDVEIPNLVSYVKDYDLWRFTLGEPTKWMNKYIRTLDFDLETWDKLCTDLENKYIHSEILTIGKKNQAVHDDEVRRIALKAKVCTIAGEKGLCVMCPPEFSSDVGHALAVQSGTYGAPYRRREDGSEVWSLRSVGTYDVAVLAEKFGGGGHKTAAGFGLGRDDVELIGIGII